MMKMDKAIQQEEEDILETLPEEYLELLFQKDRHGQWGQWIHGLIHNINGPLQNISILGEMLEQGQARISQPPPTTDSPEYGVWQQAAEKQAHRLKQLNQQVGLLGEMLQDFMQLHQVEQSDSEVDLKFVIVKLARVFRADPFFKHQVKLELQLNETLPFVRLRGRDLVPALVHIIDNALIAMRQSPEKRLTIQSRLKDKQIQIIIKDSGCGLPGKSGGGRMFELFHSQWHPSLAQTWANEKHFGFGLFAAQRLLSPYGAEVSLHHDGEGTSTVLTIPLPT